MSSIENSIKAIEREWDYLLTESHRGFALKVFPIEGSKRDFRVAVDSEHRLHVLVRVEEEPPKIAKFTELVEGIAYGERTLLVDGIERRFFDLHAELEKRSLFSPFAVYFLERLKISGPIEAVLETQKKFKRFWEGKIHPLTDLEQLGLIGELSTLMKLSEFYQLEKIVDFWSGPSGALHDIQAQKLDIEVKSTFSEPPIIHINDFEQLVPLDTKDLILIVHLFAKGNGISLPDMVEKLMELLSSDKMSSSNLEEKLKKVGYRNEHIHLYRKQFLLKKSIYLNINEDTPTLSPRLLGEIPLCISDIRYNLHLKGLDYLALGPKEWAAIANRLI